MPASMLKRLGIFYGNALDDYDETKLVALLSDHHQVIVDAHALTTLLAHFAGDEFPGRVLANMNLWGSPFRSVIGSSNVVVQPGPGDLGMPPVVTQRGVHCYVQSDEHVRMFWEWMMATAHGYGVGLFLDDWAPDRSWWELSVEDKDTVWGPKNGRPGWRDGDGWNYPRLTTAGHLARVTASLRECDLMTNGIMETDVPRLWEHVGRWISPMSVQVDAENGWTGAVTVPAYDPDGSWAVVTEPYGGYEVGTSFKAVVADVSAICEKYGLALGLCYSRRPEPGRSIYSLYWPELVDTP